MSEIKKVVLAYSGGLDTSIIIPWLKENYNGCEVIAVSGDVGQGTELDGLEEKAIATGASKLYIADLKKEFVDDYVYPTLKAGAVYENKYLLGTSFARPIIAKRIADGLENGSLDEEINIIMSVSAPEIEKERNRAKLRCINTNIIVAEEKPLICQSCGNKKIDLCKFLRSVKAPVFVPLNS